MSLEIKKAIDEPTEVSAKHEPLPVAVVEQPEAGSHPVIEKKEGHKPAEDPTIDPITNSEINKMVEWAGKIASQLKTALSEFNKPVEDSVTEALTKFEQETSKITVGDIELGASVNASIALGEVLQALKDRSNPQAQPIAHVEDLLIEWRNKAKNLAAAVESEAAEDISGSTTGSEKNFNEPDRFQQGAHADPHQDKEPA